jgi:hypothetical protein
LGGRRSELFFREGLDDPNQVESVRKIRFYAQGIFQAMRRLREAMFVRNCPSGESNAAQPMTVQHLDLRFIPQMAGPSGLPSPLAKNPHLNRA